MFGFTSLKDSVTQLAQQVQQAGYSVDASYGEEYVKIIRKQDQVVTSMLDGNAATEYIDHSTSLAKAASVDITTALLAEAKAYVDSY